MIFRAPATKNGALISEDRKSTRLNSSHGYISYAVFCLKKKEVITRVVYLGQSMGKNQRHYERYKYLLYHNYFRPYSATRQIKLQSRSLSPVHICPNPEP